MTGKKRVSVGREYAAVLILLAVSAVILLGCLAMPWVSVTVVDLGSREESVTGSSLFPAANACALLALAGIAGLIATRTLGRRITGMLMLGAGAVAMSSGIYFAASGEALAAEAVVARGSMDWTGLTLAAWWFPASLAGLGVLLAGAVTTVHGHSWPTLGSRYERGSTVGRAAASPWDAMESGVDPTEDPQVPDPRDGPSASDDQGSAP